jgi:hypothetical protein
MIRTSFLFSVFHQAASLGLNLFHEQVVDDPIEQSLTDKKTSVLNGLKSHTCGSAHTRAKDDDQLF